MDQLLLPILLVGLVLLMFNSTRKRKREAATTQSSLVPGAQIITTAGLYATVVEVEDTAVVLEVQDGSRSRWARGAISRIIEPAPATETIVGAESIADADTTGTTPGRVDLGKTADRDTSH